MRQVQTLTPGCYTGVSTTCESETAEDENNFEDTLLWIHQEKWQQELLTKYGNDISLMMPLTKLVNMSCHSFSYLCEQMLAILLWHSSSHQMKLLKIFRNLWRC